MQAFDPALAQPLLTGTTTERSESLRRQLDTVTKQPSNDQTKLQEQLTEFASLLILQMLQAMRKTVPKSQLLDSGLAQDFYVSLLDQEVARQVAHRQAFGVVPLMLQQFKMTAGHSTSTVQVSQALDAYRKLSPGQPESFIDVRETTSK